MDQSGSSFDGVITNATYTADSPFPGTSLQFTNVGASWVDIGASSNFASPSISVAVWVKTASTSQQNVINIGQSSSDVGLAVRTYPLLGGGEVIGVQFGDGSNDSFFELRSSNAISITDWTHVAATFDDATRTGVLYINGAVADTFVSSGSISYSLSNASRIAARYNGLYSYAGLIDEVRIYSGVLTQSGVESLVAPEPSGLAVFAAGFAFGGIMRRRKRRAGCGR